MNSVECLLFLMIGAEEGEVGSLPGFGKVKIIAVSIICGNEAGEAAALNR